MVTIVLSLISFVARKHMRKRKAGEDSSSNSDESKEVRKDFDWFLKLPLA